MHPLPFPLSPVFFVLGTLVGSFLNVVIARLPRGESVVHPRSRCPRCKDMIPAWLNVPIISWLMLRGRCRACRLPISVRYPTVELLTGVLFLAAYARFGLSLAVLCALLLAASLVAITFIDIDEWFIPDEISLPGILIGAGLRPFAFDVPWWSGLVGAALGAAFLAFVRWAFFIVRKTEGMGLGDVKLIAMIGAFLGPGALIPCILVASLAGTVIGGLVLLFAPRGDAGADPSGTKPRMPPEHPPEKNGQASPPPGGHDATAGALARDETDNDASEQGLDEDDDWTPPRNAVPFGPFLALGALTHLFFGGHLERLFLGLRPWL
jgi:leader peptidase (prepilin peptidase)/N-methyltransferase